jgi:translocation and assembly module TamB
MSKSAKKWVRNVILFIFLLIILFIVLLHTPFVKNLVRGKLEAYMTAKTGGQFRIASINYRLPKWIQMNDVSVRTQMGDTILMGEKIRVDINLLKILRGKYEINKIQLEKVYVDAIKKPGDSTFNYQFLIDAFTTKSTQQKKDTTPLVLSLNEIHIIQSGFRYIDPQSGMAMNTKIGRLDLLIDSIDVYKMHFAVSRANMSDVLFDMKATPATTLGNGLKPTLPVISIGESHIERTRFIYSDENTGISTDDRIRDLHLTGMKLQASGSILMGKVVLEGSDVLVNRRSFDNARVRLDTITGALVNDSLGVFHIRQFQVTNTRLVYNDIEQTRKRRGFDISHIAIRDLQAYGSDVDYTGKKINAGLSFVSGKDKSGFIVDSLHGNISMTDSVLSVANLSIATPYSRIRGDALIYPFSFLPGNRANVQNRIRVVDNRISKKDLTLLAPEIVNQYSRQLAGISTVYLDADASGNAGRMVVKRLRAYSDRKDVIVDASGTVWNGTNTKALRFDARINQLNVTRSVIDGFMTDKIRQQVVLPPTMNVKGTVSGSINSLTNNLTATSAFGTATIKGTVSNYMNPQRLVYNLSVLAKDLETGKWIKQDSMLGKVNGTIAVKGSGIDFKTAQIQAGIDLASFRVMQHTYSGIHANIAGQGGNYEVKGNTEDPLLNTRFDASVSVGGKYPAGKGILTIRNADPFALGLYKDTLSFTTHASFDIENLEPTALDAMVRLDSTVLRQSQRVLRTDSLLVRGYQDSGLTHIAVNSSPLDALVKGKYNYLQLGTIFQQEGLRYISNTPSPDTLSYSIDMAAELKPDPMYLVFLPGLFFDKNISMRGRIDDNRTDSSRYVDISAPGITYNGTTLAKLKLNAVDVNDSLRFVVTADTIRAGAIQLYSTAIRGGLHKSNLSANLSTLDKAGTERFAFSVKGNKNNELYNLQFADQVKLNYENWQVNGNNNVAIGTAGFNVSQFSISKGTEQVSINSAGTELNAPIDLKVERFGLDNITALYNADSVQLTGQLNASVRVADFDKSVPTLDGTVTVDNLKYQQIPIGRIDVKATTSAAGAVTLAGALTGYGNNVSLNGTYDQQTLNAQLNLNPVRFQTIEPFVMGQLKNSSGYIYGPINITGSVAKPEWNGSLRFDSIRTRLTQFGTALHIHNQTIDLKYPVISFNQFTIRDSVNHELIVNGTLTQRKDIIPEGDLTVKTKDFVVMNSTSAANNMLYGTAIIDVDAKIRGPLAGPDITGSIGLKDGSNVTFVKQPIIATAKERENIIQFVDMDTVKTEFIAPPVQRRTEYALLRYDLNISISKEAQFNVIIDPLTRDELQVRGAAELNAGVAPNGEISLSGAYNLSRGSYQMNYQFLRRKFDLQEGSTLVFSGDPMDAVADITAIYDVDAAPFDLITNEVSDNSGIDSRLYSQRIPFQVMLRITGRISAPQLAFDIKIKENTAGLNYTFATTIDNKLQQLRGDPSSMNRQVFGLLLMGRFIGDQSTDFFTNIGGSSGYGADEIVKESVSRFLTDAVNQVAANLIQGVDINVDLATAQDYSTATERTDLNVAFSKRFLNDRLSVTVGKSFTVEGDNAGVKTQNANQGFIPDISTTYKLSRDGRYMLKVYQRNQYEAILDGYFIETGVSFSLVMDYNKFREIFRKRGKP